MRWLFPLVILSVCMTQLRAQDDLKAFPQPDDGFDRYVLRLEPQEDESLLKVEILVGKTVETDSVNQYFFSGTIAPVNIDGWGYTRYVVKSLGPMAGTLIAVPPDAAKVERFITLRGEPYLVRYNSRLPLVVYVPEDVQVKVRLWRADKDSKAMAKE